MRYRADIQGESYAQLHDLGQLMQLYEENYRLVRELIPDFGAIDSCEVSLLEDAMPLYLTLRERAPFTLTFTLRHEFSDLADAAPDILIRAYSDAQMAESLGRFEGHLPKTGHVVHGRPAELEARWERNLFLYKWLSYCLSCGHRFGVPSRPAARKRRQRRLDLA